MKKMLKIIKLLQKIRAFVFRYLKPSGSYWIANKSLKPLSVKFGFDRGKPIDRYWIEDFLDKNKKLIKGKCLEITDNYYTRKFGGVDVRVSDVLDINKSNRGASIIGDLRDLSSTVKDNEYDCIILTHVLGLIDDIDKAVSEIYRILKPEGSILITSSCFSQDFGEPKNYWRFTSEGMRFLLEKSFKKAKIRVYSYGNVLAGQCFWVGMSQEDIERKVLEYNDRRYPCIVAARAIK